MNSRERLQKTLNHQAPDRVPVDLGSTMVSGIHGETMYDLRKELGLQTDQVKLQDPFFMLGLVEDDLRQALKTDVVGIYLPYTKLGFRNEQWKSWSQNGRSYSVGKNFVTSTDDHGDTYAYPQGNTKAQPSAKMPKDGYYFDAIVRQGDISEANLNPREDFKTSVGIYSEADLLKLEKVTDHYYRQTDMGLMGNFIGTSFGDYSSLPGPNLIETPGIRELTDWLMAHIMNPSYIKEIFDYQTEVAILNLKRYKEAVGNKIQGIYVSGTDFGTQHGEMTSPDVFRELYKPYYTKVNTWIHENTTWKTFYHSCGSIVNLLDDFVEMGVDILNPVQCSAVGMEAHFLKETYGDKLVFWGGGIDTQDVLPFGTPEEVKAQTLERLEIFSKDGGYVFNPIHNIQAGTPMENLLAMFEAVETFNRRA